MFRSSRLCITNVSKLQIPTSIGIGTGNPGVFQGYPHLYPRKPAPVPKGMGTGMGSAKTRGYATHVRVCPKTDSETLQQQCKCQSTPPCSIARLTIRGGGVGISSLISLVRVPWVVLMVVLAFVLVFVGVFVFMFMQYIVVSTNAGADGCSSRTRPAWLGEHSQGKGAACRVCGSAALHISSFLS